MSSRFRRIRRKVRAGLTPKKVGRISRTGRRRAVCAFAVVVLLAAGVIYHNVKSADKYRMSGDVDDKDLYITYDGKEYEYNNQLYSFLIIGTDGRGKFEKSDAYGSKARADNITLIILDRRNKGIKVLPLSRDSMCYVTKYSSGGYDEGSITTHLGFAFSYGDGADVSCENTCEAVSNLLYGAEVRSYVAANLDSLPFVNEMLGGVTVTVPNNDLYSSYPEFKKGNVTKINDSNVEAFLRYRDTGEDFSNNGRMERQCAYAEGVLDTVKGYGEGDFLNLWDDLEKATGKGEGKYAGKLLTNLTKGQFLKYGAMVPELSFDPDEDTLEIEGENKVENGHDVFYPDEDKLKELVIDTFYVER